MQRKRTSSSHRRTRPSTAQLVSPDDNTGHGSRFYMKDDVDSIFVSLRQLLISDARDAKRVSSLLETLLSILISNKSNHTMTLVNFTDEILILDKFLTNTIPLVKDKISQKDYELIETLNLILRNYQHLLKLTTNLEIDLLATLLENLYEHLTKIKEILCNKTTDLDANVVMRLNNICLLLLKCIYQISSKNSISYKELNKIAVCSKYIGILRCFLFYGLEKYDLSLFSTQLYPSPIGQLSVNDPFEQGLKKRRNKFNEDELLEDESLFNTSSITLTTSECSSSEIDEESFRDIIKRGTQNRKVFTKMRMLAYECLQSNLPIFGIRTIFGFWSFLFPDCHAVSGNIQFSILSTIANDNSNRVRTSALNFMFDFFDYGKQYIKTLVMESAGGKQTTSKSFTPLSESLTSMIKEVHTFFHYMLARENNSAVLILLYKVLSLIVSITPYRRLSSEILHPLFRQNSVLLDSRVTQIKNLSLALYVKIFSLEVIPEELVTWITNDKSGKTSIEKVLTHCFEFIENSDYILLSIESIKLLISLLKHHVLVSDLISLKIARFNMDSLCKISIEVIRSEKPLNNPVLQSLMCKLLYSISLLMKNATSKNIVIFKPHDQVEFVKQWYLNVIDSTLFRRALVEQDTTTVQNASQVSLINMLSLIPEQVFCQLEKKTRYHIISLLISISKCAEMATSVDECELWINNKAAAVRCLSILQSFQCLSDDMGLISDLIEVCIATLEQKDRQFMIQKKKEITLLEHTLWALANTCDTIKKNHLEFELELSQLKQIIFCVLQGFDSKHIVHQTDDIFINLVRASGFVLFVIFCEEGHSADGPEFTQRRDQCWVDQIDAKMLVAIVKNMTQLLSSKKLYKLQWNICIALSYPMALDQFVTMCMENEEDESNLLLDMYSSLLQTYVCTPNHKVQSYSIYTICKVSQLKHLNRDDNLCQLWLSVVDKFVANFNQVPMHTFHSWLDKFTFALERLWSERALFQHQDNVSFYDAFIKLKAFLDKELNCTSREADYLDKLAQLSRLVNSSTTV